MKIMLGKLLLLCPPPEYGACYGVYGKQVMNRFPPMLTILSAKQYLVTNTEPNGVYAYMYSSGTLIELRFKYLDGQQQHDYYNRFRHCERFSLYQQSWIRLPIPVH